MKNRIWSDSNVPKNANKITTYNFKYPRWAKNPAITRMVSPSKSVPMNTAGYPYVDTKFSINVIFENKSNQKIFS